jgi:ubiquinone/menaquinone biosynthesis C-methylase UbiE
MKALLKYFLPNSVITVLRDSINKIKKIDDHEAYIKAVKNRDGLEVGGPSDIFRYAIPVYSDCNSLAFANYSSESIWEKRLRSDTKYFKNKYGKQHIAEATDLSVFDNNEFEFIISSNCLEHVANPIKALYEWKRVGSGKIILILPKRNSNFDHKRPITQFKHILEDYEHDVDEHDLTHLQEILEVHDLSLDKAAGSFDQFKQRSLNNYENRCLHHHVFDPELVEKMCEHIGLNVITQSSTAQNWIFLLSA